MKFSDSQIEEIKKWVADGASVGDVQKRIEQDFGMSIRYMDVRFLLDDIDAQLKDKAPASEPAVVSEAADLQSEASSPADAEPAAGSEYSEPDAFASAAEEFNKDEIDGLPNVENETSAEDSASDSEEAGADEKVKVTLDKTPRQGAFASGSVTFSDGAQSDWMVDMNGQLGLLPSVAGYSPPQEDIPVFQKQLQKLLGVEEENEDDSKIEITVSPIQRPDCIAFGDVTFSDATKAEWRLDRMGQLTLIPAVADKKPPQEEMGAFQRKLSKLLGGR